jgi:hypothetical protein
MGMISSRVNPQCGQVSSEWRITELLIFMPFISKWPKTDRTAAERYSSLPTAI